MSATTQPPGGGPEPAPPAPSLSAGGDDLNNDDFSPLLDLLQRFPDLFEKYVLERLDPAAPASLARAGSAFWDVVFPRSIFPFGLLRSETPPAAGAARVFKLVDFLRSAKRLAWANANGSPWVAATCWYAAWGGNLAALKWAREHGCPWDEFTCWYRRSGWAPGGAEVCAGARLSVGCGDMQRRRTRRAPSGAAVGAGARLPVEFSDDV
jgi:hypothetical protein